MHAEIDRIANTADGTIAEGGVPNRVVSAPEVVTSKTVVAGHPEQVTWRRNGRRNPTAKALLANRRVGIDHRNNDLTCFPLSADFSP